MTGAARELQDATALAAIIRAYEDVVRGTPSVFSAQVILLLTEGWKHGTLTDRLRLNADDPLARRAQELGLFSWRRGQRFKNRLPS